MGHNPISLAFPKRSSGASTAGTASASILKSSAHLNLRLSEELYAVDPGASDLLSPKSSPREGHRSSNTLKIIVDGLSLAGGTALLLGSKDRSASQAIGVGLMGFGGMGLVFEGFDWIVGPPTPRWLKLSLAAGTGLSLGLLVHFGPRFDGSGLGGNSQRYPTDEFGH